MSNKKGFTLIEIIVVSLIVGILALIALPNYNNMMEEGMANAALNNLRIILNAEQNYYFNNSSAYYFTSGLETNGLTQLNTALNLNMVDTNYTLYTCESGNSGPAGQPGLTCTAMRFANGGPAGPSTTLVYQKYPPINTSNPYCASGQNFCPPS